MRRVWAIPLATGCSVAIGLTSGCRTSPVISKGSREPIVAAAPPTAMTASAQASIDEKLVRSEATIPDRQANIDLSTALEIAGSRNPTINLAREFVVEAVSRQNEAKALVFPSLSAGANLRIHLGPVQQSNGNILNVDSQSLYYGAGSRVVGTGTASVPGIRAFYPLGDVVLERRAAEQVVAIVRGDSAAVQNLTLLDVATAYLELLNADATLESLRLGEGEFAEIARLTTANAKAGQGRDADAKRAEANLDLLRRQSLEIRGERGAASARLAAMLGADPTLPLIPPGGKLYPLGFFDSSAEADSLVALALQSRPEVNARASEIAESTTRLRQEQLRPWLPTVVLGYSAGGFGGGSDLNGTSYSNFGSRSDFDVAAVWSIQNAGIGNRASQHRGRARIGQAVARLDSTQNQVHAEVLDSLTQIQAAWSRIETARRQLTTAQDGFTEEMTRIKQGEGRPLEALDSTRQLTETRLELIRAITDHNIAQFRLFAAVGSTPGAQSPTAR